MSHFECVSRRPPHATRPAAFAADQNVRKNAGRERDPALGAANHADGALQPRDILIAHTHLSELRQARLVRFAAAHDADIEIRTRQNTCENRRLPRMLVKCNDGRRPRIAEIVSKAPTSANPCASIPRAESSARTASSGVMMCMSRPAT